jgi:hypothetical protein
MVSSISTRQSRPARTVSRSTAALRVEAAVAQGVMRQCAVEGFCRVGDEIHPPRAGQRYDVLEKSAGIPRRRWAAATAMSERCAWMWPSLCR